MNTSSVFVWLRRYVVIAAVIVLAGVGWAVWRYYQFIHISAQGWERHTLRGFAINVSLLILFALLLLFPWWRFGRAVRQIGIILFLFSGALATWRAVWAVLHGGQVLSVVFVVTAFVGHSLWLFRAPKSKFLAHR